MVSRGVILQKIPTRGAEVSREARALCGKRIDHGDMRVGELIAAKFIQGRIARSNCRTCLWILDRIVAMRAIEANIVAPGIYTDTRAGLMA